MRLWLCFLLPVLALILGYLATNLLATGHLMPVSGRIKFGGVAEILCHGGGFHALMPALLAPTHHPRFALISLCVLLPWLLCAVARMPRWATRLAPIRRYRVFYAGATGAYLYYLLCNYAVYALTGWYYLPHIFLAVFGIAALLNLVEQHIALPAAQTAAVIPLLLLGVLGYSTLSLVHDTAVGTPQWNARLYATARWLRVHLPADARLCAADAGILGYFSGHVVVNIDGLVNDYTFYERYLRPGKRDDYCQQWDYLVNAFPDGTELARRFPRGQDMPLPPSLAAPFHAPGRDGFLRMHLIHFPHAFITTQRHEDTKTQRVR